MRCWMLPIALACMCLTPWGFAASPQSLGRVELRDGRVTEGTIRLEKGALVVVVGSGETLRLEPSAIQRIAFQAPPAQEPPSRPARTASPPTKPPAAPQPVQGLRAEYYAGSMLKDQRLVRIDPRIEFFWWDAPPDPVVPRTFSVRWTGRIEPAFSELYTFEANVAEGCRLWIDQRLIVDRWNGPPGNHVGKIELKAGRPVDLKLEYQGHPNGGSALLLWSSASQAQEVVPPKRLFPPSGSMPPLVRFISPENESLVSTRGGVALEVEATDSDGKVSEVQFYADSRLIGRVQSPPWRFTWDSAAAGPRTLRARAVDDTGMTADSEQIRIVVGTDGEGTLPRPWVQAPVGTEQPAGLATGLGQGFTLEAAGDYWGEPSAFHYVCQEVEGDGSLVAKLERLRAGREARAVAGLLLRDSLLASKAREAFVGAMSDGGLSFAIREHSWSARTSHEEPGAVPCWLKLAREGKTVRAYRSNDGSRWELIAERKIDLPAKAYWGLMVAGADQKKGEASFDAVALSRGAPAAAGAVKGIVLRSGSVIGGNVHSFSDTSIRMFRAGGEVVAPTSEVARLLFRPVSAEAIGRLEPGRSGALLTNGDFFEGRLTRIKDGQVHFSSLLLGPRAFTIWGEMAAAILRDVSPAPGAWEVRAADGSMVRASEISFEAGKLRAVDTTGVAVPLAPDDLVELRMMAPPASH